jgi:hypothetical protein
VNLTPTLTVAEYRKMQERPKREVAPKVNVNEGDILKQIRNVLRAHRWFVVRHQQGLGSMRGIPDLSAESPDGVHWWIEVKKPGGTLSEHQEEFRDEVLSRHGRWMVAKSVEDIEPLLERGAEK